MVSSRTLTALVGLVASVLVSVVAYVYFDTLLVFLFVPFVPFLFRRLGGDSRSPPPIGRCPSCGFETRNPEVDYCPYDGTRLRADE